MVDLKDKAILYLIHNKHWKFAQIHSLSQLWSNFESVLLSLNRNILPSSFSISEINNVRHEILKKVHTPFSTNKFLYGINGHSKIKIHLDDGNVVPLLVFNRSGKNYYQIARDIKIPTTNGIKTIDTLLLINGLPMVQIGENNYGADPKDILTSIHNLQSSYVTQNSLLSAIQILIGMSSKDIRYMANNSIKYHFEVAFSFHWTKDNNKLPVTNWLEFSHILLSPTMVQKIITNYIITDNAYHHQSIKVMRPYQISSTRKIISRLENYDFDHGNHKIGYIWHTTGSGKTISSFKTAWLATKLPNVDKVVYLVDRVALSNQTANKYKDYDPRNVKTQDNQFIIGTHSTDDLEQALNERQTNIIVTSTQKLDSLMTNRYFSLPDCNVVFIVDEAHQGIGSTFLNIKKAFPRSAWVGYTGTPRFKTPNKQVFTTEQIFGAPLDVYTIGEAVRDQNVLGFHVDFKSTIPNNELRNKYLPMYIHRINPKLSLAKVNEKIQKLSLNDCKKLGRGIYDMNYKHVHLVVKDIISNWPKRSNNYKYNALFTTHVNLESSKNMAVMYFKEFLRQNKYLKRPLKVAITFSPDNTSTQQGYDMNSTLLWCMDKYDQMFGTHFSDFRDFNGYKNDLISRLNKTNPTKQYLDLVIVVDQLLTGFDAPQLNTLYIDRILGGAKLIQAYSRTNRIYNMQDKPFGNIITYRWPEHAKAMMDKAFKIYADPRSAHIWQAGKYNPNQIFASTYQQSVKALAKILSKIRIATHGFKLIPSLIGEQEEIYGELKLYNGLVTRIKQYDEYRGPKQLLQELGLSSSQEYFLTVVLAKRLKKNIARNYHIAMDSLNLKMEYIGDIKVNSNYLYSVVASYVNATHEANQRNPKVKALHSKLYNTLKKLDNHQYVSRIKKSIQHMNRAYQSEVSAHTVQNSVRVQRNNDVNKFEQHWGMNNAESDIKDLLNSQNKPAKTALVRIIKNGVQNYRKMSNSETIKNNNPISYKIQLVYALKHLISRNREQ